MFQEVVVVVVLSVTSKSKPREMELSYASFSSITCKNDCREIHATWNQLNLVGRALARRTLTQKRQIKEMYRAMYGQDLVEQLQKTHLANSTNEVR